MVLVTKKSQHENFVHQNVANIIENGQNSRFKRTEGEKEKQFWPLFDTHFETISEPILPQPPLM